MKKHIYSISLLFFILINNTNAQDYLSFYNLKDYVIQTQDVSPIYLPKYKVNIGTPLNTGFNLNSDIKISDILVESGNNLKIDFNNLNSVAAEANAVVTDIVANIFMLGFKTKKGSITFFANAKSNLAWEFTKEFTNVAANGFGESFALTAEKIGFTSYSEIGVGITRTFLEDKLAIALRLKSLSGIAQASLEDDAQFSLDINPANFLWTVNTTNATVNTSGVSDTENLSFFGKNGGFGMDIGLAYELNNKLSFEFSMNDLGSITWEDNVTNYNLQDVTNGVYSGFDFQNSGNIETEIEDALNNVLGATETQESFKTKIGSRTFFSAKYKLSEKNILRATYFSNNNPYINIKPSFGLGYNRALNKATYGIVASTGGNNGGFRLGANLAVQLGFLQIYTALEDISNIGGKVQEANTANFRFGMNFLFGYKGKSKNIEEEDDKEDKLEISE
ncbi:DUF5723 family protein [Polaribacter sp. R77954]|uniref:DUF5723 family protein n=1 Tax=Polaribacter sp. R77954 TaxID=3093870 RepID=UPI0037CC446C